MSPRMLRTTARLPTETLGLEGFAGLDGQGFPSYDAPVDFEANVVEYDTALRARGGHEHVITEDGSKIETPLTLYVQGTASVVPDEQDRITRGGTQFIVREKTTVQGLHRLASEPDHFRLRCSREGA